MWACFSIDDKFSFSPQQPFSRLAESAHVELQSTPIGKIWWEALIWWQEWLVVEWGLERGQRYIEKIYWKPINRPLIDIDILAFLIHRWFFIGEILGILEIINIDNVLESTMEIIKKSLISKKWLIVDLQASMVMQGWRQTPLSTVMDHVYLCQIFLLHNLEYPHSTC